MLLHGSHLFQREAKRINHECDLRWVYMVLFTELQCDDKEDKHNQETGEKGQIGSQLCTNALTSYIRERIERLELSTGNDREEGLCEGHKNG